MSYWWEQYVPYIQSLEKKTGIPTSVVLGQMIQESGANSPSGLATTNNNLFGVKGVGTKGTGSFATTEVINGKTVHVMSGFANYNTPLDSINAYEDLLMKPNYAKNLTGATSVNAFVQGIKNSGYATDPNYVNSVLRNIGNFDLNKYNVNKSLSFTPVAGGLGTDSSSGGIGIASTITDFLKTMEENSLKFGIYLILFIVFVFFGFQAINSVPAIKETTGAVKTSGKKLTRTVKTVAKVIPK
jgi:hypothetical protein